MRVPSDSYIAYSYLEAAVKFSLPYDQNKRPLIITEGNGRKLEVHSFGLSLEGHNQKDNLWKQPLVLFRTGEPAKNDFEFAIDLCADSSPSQVVVARIKRPRTLGAGVSEVEKSIQKTVESLEESSSLEKEQGHRLEVIDKLWVPDCYWFISHHFTELEGQKLTNARLRGYKLVVAKQDILFRFDRTGAVLGSESTGGAFTAIPTHFVFDRPFLLYMKLRKQTGPYFAMWVDNAELLRPWHASKDQL